MIRILLVDDHGLVRSKMKLLLNEIETLQVIGETENCEDTIRAVHELHPEIVLIDLNISNMGGFETIARLLRYDPTLKIIVFGTDTRGLVSTRLLELGVAGYLNKRANQREMLRAIEAVYEGNHYIDPPVAEAIASFQVAAQNNPPPLL